MRIIKYCGAVWGIIGVCALLVYAVGRVLPFAVEGIQTGLSPLEWTALILWCMFMLESEGIDGFQNRFSPRVSERAQQIRMSGTWLQILLAPLYCIGYFGAVRKRMIVSYGATIGIIIMILLVHQLAQPWRGILDSGVVVGLGYGIFWTILCGARSFREGAKHQK